MKAILWSFLLLALVSCVKDKQQTWVLLIDRTVYDREDMAAELSKFKNRLKERMEEYDEFKNIKNTSVFAMEVDDHGSNKVKECLKLPKVQGWKKKNVKTTIKDLDEKCLNPIFKKIKKRHHKNYQKTLYVEALNRSLEEFDKYDRNGIYKIIIFGDLAIVDDECHMEKDPCTCQKWDKITQLKKKINSYKKKFPNLCMETYQINIPKEEACRENRNKIWDVLKKPLRC